MSTHDLDGRPYAKLSELKAGDLVESDADFTCLRGGSRHLVCSGSEGLYIHCLGGYHYLVGQLSESDNDSLVGLYKVLS